MHLHAFSHASNYCTDHGQSYDDAHRPTSPCRYASGSIPVSTRTSSIVLFDVRNIEAFEHQRAAFIFAQCVGEAAGDVIRTIGCAELEAPIVGSCISGTRRSVCGETIYMAIATGFQYG